MANYVFSNYVIEGKKAELDEFESLLKRLESMEEKDFPVKDISWGSRWLGFLVNELGGDLDQYNCKGEWFGLERRSDDALALDINSAWWPPEDLMNLIADKWPSFNYYFYREEPGCEMFETNDVDGKYFPRRYRLFGYIPIKNEEGEMEGVEFEEYPASEDDVINYVSTNLQHPIESIEDIDEWNKQLEENTDDSLFDGVNPYIYIDEIKVLVQVSAMIMHSVRASKLRSGAFELMNQFKFDKALELHLEALEYDLRLGESHPDVGDDYHNIGTTYFNLGDREKAIEYLLKALEVHDKVYGPENEASAFDCKEIAYTYLREFENAKALKYYKKALVFYQEEGESDEIEIIQKRIEECELDLDFDDE